MSKNIINGSLKYEETWVLKAQCDIEPKVRKA